MLVDFDERYKQSFGEKKMAVLANIDFPPEGGTLCLYREVKEVNKDGSVAKWGDWRPPRKGYPFPTAQMSKIDAVKKILAWTIYLITKTPLGFFMLIPSFKKRLIYKLGAMVKNTLNIAILPDEMWCKSGRELKKKMNFYDDIKLGRVVKGKTDAGKNRYSNDAYRAVSIFFLNCFLVIWETDDAYRYRGQFALGNLNQYALSLKPRPELKRVILLCRERETKDSMKNKWDLIYKLISFMPPRWIKTLSKHLISLDLKEVKLDADDIFWGKEKFFNFAEN